MHNTQPEQLLVAIGGQALGYFAKPVIAVILAVGCLATAVILSTLFVDFLQKDVMQDRLERPQAILATMAITFTISLLGFSKLMTLLGTVLDVAYPALIALAVMNIVDKLMPRRETLKYTPNYTQWVFWGTFGSSMSFKLLG